MTARILVVEDERIVALDLSATLRHLGYEVVGMAASAAGAVRLARAHRPDLVLMDIHLEGAGDGTEAGTEILGELAIPVIYLTAFAEPGTLARAEASQPYGYLLKPFTGEQLRVRLTGEDDDRAEDAREDPGQESDSPHALAVAVPAYGGVDLRH